MVSMVVSLYGPLDRRCRQCHRRSATHPLGLTRNSQLPPHLSEPSLLCDSNGGSHTPLRKAFSGGFLPFPCVRHALSVRN